jgi:hypothetical protein
VNDTMRVMDEARSAPLDDAPPKVPCSGVQSEHAHPVRLTES